MSDGLTIPDELMQKALSWAAQQRFESVDVDAVTLYTAKEAAAMLKLTTQGFRLVAKEHIDLGPKSARWSLKDLKSLIEKRRVKSANRS